jgi:hypothetical protein
MTAISVETLQAITSFGKQIISPVEGVVIREPILKLSEDEIQSLLALPKGNASSPLEVGIFNLLPHILIDHWSVITSLDPIKAKLVTFLTQGLHDKSLPRLADACIDVYKHLQFEWPELIAFIFKPGPSDLNGLLLIRLLSVSESQFIETNLGQIVGVLTDLLPKSSVSVQTGLIVILATIGPDGMLGANPDLINQLWIALIHIMTEEPDRREFLQPLLSNIFEVCPAALEARPPAVASAIAAITDVKSARPILQVIQFLNADFLGELIQKLEAIAAATSGVPTELISELDDAPLGEISPPNLQVISAFLHARIATPAGLALLAPFGAAVAVIFGPDELFSVVEKCLGQSALNVSLGLKIFELLSGYTDSLEFPLPAPLMSRIVALLPSATESVRVDAYATLSALIENGVFISKDNVAELLRIYPQVAASDVARFFKLIRKLLRLDDIDDALVDPIFQFAAALAADRSAIVRAQALSVLCALTAKEAGESAVAAQAAKLSPVAVDLVRTGGAPCYTFATRALVLFVSVHADACRRAVLGLLPKLFDVATGKEQTEPKVQGNVAVALTTIAVCLNVSKDFGRLLDILNSFLGSAESHLVKAAATIATLLRTTKDASIAVRAFRAVAQAAIQSRDRDLFNALLEALRKLTKACDIPECEAVPLVESVLTGAHPIFNRRPPSMFTDKDTKLYSFLRGVAIRYPSRLTDIAQTVLQWLLESPSFMLPVFLEVVKYLVEVKAIAGPVASQVARLLLRAITGSGDSMDEVLLGIVIMLVQADPAALDNDRLVSQLLTYWQESAATEETGWRAQIATGILELCAMGAEMDEDVVVDILADYPYDYVFGKTNAMSVAICALMDDPADKWAEIAPEAAQSIVSVLLMKKEELEEHAMEPDTIHAMKRVLKKTFKAKPAIEREIRKGLAKKRPLINRLDAILK